MGWLANRKKRKEERNRLAGPYVHPEVQRSESVLDTSVLNSPNPISTMYNPLGGLFLDTQPASETDPGSSEICDTSSTSEYSYSESSSSSYESSSSNDSSGGYDSGGTSSDCDSSGGGDF